MTNCVTLLSFSSPSHTPEAACSPGSNPMLSLRRSTPPGEEDIGEIQGDAGEIQGRCWAYAGRRHLVRARVGLSNPDSNPNPHPHPHPHPNRTEREEVVEDGGVVEGQAGGVIRHHVDRVDGVLRRGSGVAGYGVRGLGGRLGSGSGLGLGLGVRVGVGVGVGVGSTDTLA